ncbi:MAG: diguanylate cyclase [Mariprofundus sp.]|nr:diguanylate cyclase [Mariprofundus sp.]
MGITSRPDLQAALAALKEAYKEKIPLRIDELKLGWKKVKGASEDRALSKNLHRQMHTFSGTASTYGFIKLGELASQMETLVQKVLARHTSTLWLAADIDAGEGLLQKLESVMADNLQLGQMKTVKSPTKVISSTQPRPLRGNRSAKPVYLVDDNVDFLKTTELQLQAFGFDVVSFATLSDFNKAVEQREPAAVVMDIEFPEGAQSGIEDIAQLNVKRQSPLPTIFITANRDVMVRLKAVRAGGIGYFLKPVRIEYLADMLTNLTSPSDEEPFRIMVVDDSVEQTTYIETILQQAGMHTHAVNNPLSLLDQLSEGTPDLILMDLYMQGCTGLELSQVIRQMDEYVNIPIVFLSKEMDLEKQMHALSSGGDDFLAKIVQPWHLVSALSNRVRRSRMVRKLAETDGLTGLLNHTKSKERLEAELARAKRENNTLSFAMIDVDLFKKVNDQYGHPAGDRVLKSLANLCTQSVRQYDSVGRYGGEEFVLILPNTDATEAKQIMDKLRISFRNINHVSEGQIFQVSFSCGVASYPYFDSATQLAGEADKALYIAKECDRNNVVIAGQTASSS